MERAATTTAFAAFRAAAASDAKLLADLRAATDRDSFARLAVARGAALGFPFAEDDVRAALRAGEDRFLAVGADVAQTPVVPDGPCDGGADDVAGWTPFRAVVHGGRVTLDWCHLGRDRMLTPFHFETIVAAMRAPFNLAFQRTTPIEAVDALPDGVPLAGIVFHMSRCGSTLISQAFAALPDTIVLAEATPLRTVLRAHAVGLCTGDETVAALRRLVKAYAQRRFPDEARLVVKVMAGDVLDIALVRAAFPAVPWAFVTRDPAAILASQRRDAGIDLSRGQIPAARLGLTEEALWAIDAWAYKARVLKAYVEAGLAALTARHAGAPGLLLDHADLPDAIWTRLAPHFGVPLSDASVARMRAVAGRHSKHPERAFAAAADPSRLGAAAFRDLADTILGPLMARLAAHGAECAEAARTTDAPA